MAEHSRTSGPAASPPYLVGRGGSASSRSRAGRLRFRGRRRQAVVLTSGSDGTSITMWLVTTGPSPANTAVQNLVTPSIRATPATTSPSTSSRTSPTSRRSSSRWARATRRRSSGPGAAGPLQQYIKAGDVYAPGHPSWLCSFLPSSLGAVTYKGKVYGVPVEGTQPVYFFYNKSIFAKYHLTFPTTFSGLLSTVAKLKSHGVAPISLANGDQWPGLMYLEYLTDRIGGPAVAKALQSNTASGWSNPAVTQALDDIQQLVKAGAFQSGYDSLHYSGGGSDALVYSGKAAMQLMGDWDISSILGSDKSFVNGGDLGMAPFPAWPAVTATRPTWPATPPATWVSPATPPRPRRPSPWPSSRTS